MLLNKPFFSCVQHIWPLLTSRSPCLPHVLRFSSNITTFVTTAYRLDWVVCSLFLATNYTVYLSDLYFWLCPLFSPTSMSLTGQLPEGTECHLPQGTQWHSTSKVPCSPAWHKPGSHEITEEGRGGQEGNRERRGGQEGKE